MLMQVKLKIYCNKNVLNNVFETLEKLYSVYFTVYLIFKLM